MNLDPLYTCYIAQLWSKVFGEWSVSISIFLHGYLSVPLLYIFAVSSSLLRVVQIFGRSNDLADPVVHLDIFCCFCYHYRARAHARTSDLARPQKVGSRYLQPDQALSSRAARMTAHQSSSEDIHLCRHDDIFLVHLSFSMIR